MLSLHRQLPAPAVIAGMESVLRMGAISTDLVAIEARKAMDNQGLDEAADPAQASTDHTTDPDNKPGLADEGAKVISLHARRLPPDPRPALPDMSKYDRLLTPVADPTKSRKGTSA
ncbi:hypothetical protein [Streptomyces sp. MUM 178J]|uniref:hypothetical protein n=1 Tax=Streptomyces sp. MUM 178J TaxID=2791991 RepID=UPI001F0486DF|nr:hypothetical protein [Streptomyces sp. MUM 178J]WRQ78973.1 hypothetical protein I3F59_006040 [Streptomyces sp. MUM 178J]